MLCAGGFMVIGPSTIWQFSFFPPKCLPYSNQISTTSRNMQLIRINGVTWLLQKAPVIILIWTIMELILLLNSPVNIQKRLQNTVQILCSHMESDPGGFRK